MGARAGLLLDIACKQLRNYLDAGYSLSKSAKLMGITYEKAKVLQRNLGTNS